MKSVVLFHCVLLRNADIWVCLIFSFGCRLHVIFCLSRIRKGKKATITGCGSYTEEGKRWLFHYKASTPMKDPQIMRNIIFYAVGLALKVTLKNHMCISNCKIFKQMKGGAIGVGIAGDVANLFMAWWDRKMNSLCAE